MIENQLVFYREFKFWMISKFLVSAYHKPSYSTSSIRLNILKEKKNRNISRDGRGGKKMYRKTDIFLIL